MQRSSRWLGFRVRVLCAVDSNHSGDVVEVSVLASCRRWRWKLLAPVEGQLQPSPMESL